MNVGSVIYTKLQETSDWSTMCLTSDHLILPPCDQPTVRGVQSTEVTFAQCDVTNYRISATFFFNWLLQSLSDLGLS